MMKSICKKKLRQIIFTNNLYRSRGNGVASYETQHKRAAILYQGFQQLYDMNFQLENPRNVREHHVKKLVRLWEDQGIKDIQTRVSTFRVFSRWIGNPDMIGSTVNYVKNVENARRQCATTVDKTWSGQNVNALELIRLIEAADPRMAIILMLMLIFGLRLKEALLLKPHLADRKLYLDVNRGTKGGRPRICDITVDREREILDRAQGIVDSKNSSLIPDGIKFTTYRARFYRMCRKFGICKKNGIVPHGLRHERANLRYEELAGVKSPIKGGPKIDKDTDRFVRTEITGMLGHSRVGITSGYCG